MRSGYSMVVRWQRQNGGSGRTWLNLGVLAALIVGAIGMTPGAAVSAAASAPAAQVPTTQPPSASQASAHHVSMSDLALSGCTSGADFLRIAGQGPLCRSHGSTVLRLNDGNRMTVAPPDLVSVLTASHSSPPHSTQALLSQQCASGSSPRIELVYAHFAGQADNFGGHAGDIQQIFRDVDSGFINYDSMHYFNLNKHLTVACDGSGNPVVHDVGLSTTLGGSDFSTIASDMSNQGYHTSKVHYWIWTDGNPVAALGYAGQSSIQEDDSASASNQINSAYEYSVNYGYTDGNYGAQIFAHENGHAMGAVQLSAPDTTGAFHCTDGTDVMCYNDGGPHGNLYNSGNCGLAPNGTELFDCHFNDYFNPWASGGNYLATHWNLASLNNHWIYTAPTNTSTALSESAGSGVYSQPLTLTATVSPAITSGTVTFRDGSSGFATSPLNGNGVARTTISAFGLGLHTITAVYSGATGTAGSTSPAVTYTVSQAATTTSVSTSSNPAGQNLPVTVSAIVSPLSPARGAPTGSVVIYRGDTALGTVDLNGNGVAALTTSFALGSYSLWAAYAGDGNFTASDTQASQLIETVLYGSTISVQSSAPGNTAEAGTPLTFTATVDAAPGTPNGAGAPTGSVTFKDGSTVIAAGTPLNGGSAALSTGSLAPGTHTITAVYSGDGQFAPRSSSLVETVQGFRGFYALDGFGGRHPLASPGLPDIRGGWGWVIARGIAMRSDGTSGYVLDGWGGVHPFGGAPQVSITGYWAGWDIARSIVLRPDGHSGYLLDGWGHVHPFGTAGDIPAVPSMEPGWIGWDIARSMVLRSDGSSGYILDGFGGVHPFGSAGHVPPPLSTTGYWNGWDIARCMTLDPDGLGGYVMDGWGNIHPFGNAPRVNFSSPWRGDVARAMVLVPGGLHMGYVLNGDGRVAPFGGAPAVAMPGDGLFPGRSVERGLALA